MNVIEARTPDPLLSQLLECGSLEWLTKMPVAEIDSFLDQFGVTGIAGKVIVYGLLERARLKQILLPRQDIDIGQAAFDGAGFILREFGLVFVALRDPKYERGREAILLAMMAKTVVHEAVHADGVSPEKVGFVRVADTHGYYLEEGVCEYVGRLFLEHHLPQEWMPDLQRSLAEKKQGPRYVRLSSNLATVSDKNQFGDVTARAIYLTPDRLADPSLETSAIAAVGIEILVNDFGIPLQLFLNARKDEAAYQELQQKIDQIEPGLFDKLFGCKNDRTAFWDATRYLQQLAKKRT